MELFLFRGGHHDLGRFKSNTLAAGVATARSASPQTSIRAGANATDNTGNETEQHYRHRVVINASVQPLASVPSGPSGVRHRTLLQV